MKDKEKQIEEMAKIIDDRLLEARNWIGSMNKGEGYWIADKLVEQGYRKLDDYDITVLRKSIEFAEQIIKKTAKDIFETLLLFLVGETFTVGKELKKVRKKIIKMAEEMGVDLLYEELF